MAHSEFPIRRRVSKRLVCFSSLFFYFLAHADESEYISRSIKETISYPRVVIPQHPYKDAIRFGPHGPDTGQGDNGAPGNVL